jgi:hypothetical protein
LDSQITFGVAYRLFAASTQPRPAIAPKPSMATPMASSHIRMRVQSPMLTMSATAPMVQKWVRWAMAPKTAASANAAHRTRWVRPGRSDSCIARDSRERAMSGLAWACRLPRQAILPDHGDRAMSTTTPTPPDAQREELLDNERQANRERPRNFKDDALADKHVEVEPDGTGPTSTGTFDPPADQRRGSGNPGAR